VHSGSAAVAAASFSALSGSLTQGIAPFQTLPYHQPVNVPLPALPVPVNPPTISIGGISIRVSAGGSNSGLTLTLACPPTA